MIQLYNRAWYREAVRQLFGQVTPYEDGVGAPGEQPVQNPTPTNSNINFCLDMAAAWFNTECSICGDSVPRQIPIAAQTNPGPFLLNLQQIAPYGSVNTVERVTWISAPGATETILVPADREQLDRRGLPLMTQTPGVPQSYWVEFGNLALWPAPESAGTLAAMFGTAIWQQSQEIDADRIDVVPQEWLPIIIYKTVALLCGEQPDNLEFSRLYALMTGFINDQLPKAKAFFNRRNRKQQFNMVPLTGRYGYYSGRR